MDHGGEPCASCGKDEPMTIGYPHGYAALRRRSINECRCDERLKAKVEGSARLTYTGLREGLGKPKDRHEVNKREVCECDG